MNCFAIPKDLAVKRIYLHATAIGNFNYSAEIFSIDEYGNGSTLSQGVSNSSGTLLINAQYTGQELGFSILPTSALTTNKHVSVGYFVKDDVGVIVIDFADLPTPSPTPTSVPPKTPLCKKYPCALPLTAPTAPETPLCSASSSVPAGKNPNFNIDENLAQIEARRAAIDNLPNSVDRAIVRAAAMTDMFAPGQPYDLKNAGNKYQSSQEFGNYFYGMAAAKMGYSEQSALTAGAIVQQYQNYANVNNPDANKLGVMFRNFAFAAISGLGDNPDDPPTSSAGFNAGSSCSTKNSSNQNNNNKSNGSGGEGNLGGLGHGWQGGSISLPPGCYGNCGTHGGTVTVAPPKALH